MSIDTSSINGVVVTWVVATKWRAASTRRGFDSLLMQLFFALFKVPFYPTADDLPPRKQFKANYRVIFVVFVGGG